MNLFCAAVALEVELDDVLDVPFIAASKLADTVLLVLVVISNSLRGKRLNHVRRR
jgi:hypothetical protein